MNAPTIKEAQEDLNLTQNDITLLEQVANSINNLLVLSSVENKDFYRKVLHQINSDKEQGRRLVETIKSRYSL